MAEEQTTAEESAEGGEAKKGGKLLMVGGLVGGLALGSVAGLFVLGPRLAPSPAHAATAKPAEKKEGEGKDGEGKKGEAAPVYQIDNLVLNPAGSGGTRFLLMSVALEVKDAAAAESLKGRDAELRDAILRLIGTMTVEQISDAWSHDALRSQLVTAVNQIVGAGTVRRAYFPQFVIQ